MTPCIIEGCERAAKSRGLCQPHARRKAKYGSALGGRGSPTSDTPRVVTGPGYPCPHCPNDRTEVKDSRRWNAFFRRRRYCYQCERSFSTIEIPADLFEGFSAAAIQVNLNKASSTLNVFIAEFNSLRRAVRSAVKEGGKGAN